MKAPQQSKLLSHQNPSSNYEFLLDISQFKHPLQYLNYQKKQKPLTHIAKHLQDLLIDVEADLNRVLNDRFPELFVISEELEKVEPLIASTTAIVCASKRCFKSIKTEVSSWKEEALGILRALEGTSMKKRNLMKYLKVYLELERICKELWKQSEVPVFQRLIWRVFGGIGGDEGDRFGSGGLDSGGMVGGGRSGGAPISPLPLTNGFPTSELPPQSEFSPSRHTQLPSSTISCTHNPSPSSSASPPPSPPSNPKISSPDFNSFFAPPSEDVCKAAEESIFKGLLVQLYDKSKCVSSKGVLFDILLDCLVLVNMRKSEEFLAYFRYFVESAEEIQRLTFMLYSVEQEERCKDLGLEGGHVLKAPFDVFSENRMELEEGMEPLEGVGAEGGRKGAAHTGKTQGEQRRDPQGGSRGEINEGESNRAGSNTRESNTEKNNGGESNTWEINAAARNMHVSNTQRSNEPTEASIFNPTAAAESPSPLLQATHKATPTHPNDIDGSEFVCGDKSLEKLNKTTETASSQAELPPSPAIPTNLFKLQAPPTHTPHLAQPLTLQSLLEDLLSLRIDFIKRIHQDLCFLIVVVDVISELKMFLSKFTRWRGNLMEEQADSGVSGASAEGYGDVRVLNALHTHDEEASTHASSPILGKKHVSLSFSIFEHLHLHQEEEEDLLVKFSPEVVEEVFETLSLAISHICRALMFLERVNIVENAFSNLLVKVHIFKALTLVERDYCTLLKSDRLLASRGSQLQRGPQFVTYFQEAFLSDNTLPYKLIKLLCHEEASKSSITFVPCLNLSAKVVGRDILQAIQDYFPQILTPLILDDFFVIFKKIQGLLHVLESEMCPEEYAIWKASETLQAFDVKFKYSILCFFIQHTHKQSLTEAFEATRGFKELLPFQGETLRLFATTELIRLVESIFDHEYFLDNFLKPAAQLCATSIFSYLSFTRELYATIMRKQRPVPLPSKEGGSADTHGSFSDKKGSLEGGTEPVAEAFNFSVQNLNYKHLGYLISDLIVVSRWLEYRKEDADFIEPKEGAASPTKVVCVGEDGKEVKGDVRTPNPDALGYSSAGYKHFPRLIERFTAILRRVCVISSTHPLFRKKTGCPPHIIDSLRQTLVILASLLKECRKAVDSLQEEMAEGIIEYVCADSLSHMVSVKSIPFLYRLTNREAPSRPSPYVSQLLTSGVQLMKFLNYTSITKDVFLAWNIQIVDTISEDYLLEIESMIQTVSLQQSTLEKRGVGYKASNESKHDVSGLSRVLQQVRLDVQEFESQCFEQFGVTLRESPKLRNLAYKVANLTRPISSPS